jgi:Tfp pilus assembly protein PilN
MIRINLIPPEILAKRRDERRRSWVWLGGFILLAVVALFCLFVFIQVASSTSDVASVQQQAQTLQAQTSRFDVFQKKEAELLQRKDSVSAALAGRVDWAGTLYELGLVLPTDVYLTTFTGNDTAVSGSGGSVTLAGVAVPDADKTPAIGYKSIAKVLVRLTEMTQLDNVWLTSANAKVDAASGAKTYEWSISSRITPSLATSSPAGN